MLEINIHEPQYPQLSEYGLTEDMINVAVQKQNEFIEKETKKENILNSSAIILSELLLGLLWLFFFSDHSLTSNDSYFTDSIGANIFISIFLILQGCFYGTVSMVPIWVSYELFYHLLKSIILNKRGMKKYERILVKYHKFTNKYKIYQSQIDMINYQYPGLLDCSYNSAIYQEELIKAAENCIWKIQQKEQKKSNEDWWRNLDPFAFEDEVANWFRSRGYKAAVTKRSGDGGVDIIVSKGNENSYVQCKHYNYQVGVKLVREFYGVMVADNVKTGYMVILDKGYTKDAQEFIEGKNIKTITLKDLTKGHKTSLFVKEYPNYSFINDIVVLISAMA